MRGYQRFVKNNNIFTDSKTVEVVTADYMHQNDTILTWMDDECTLARDAKAPFGSLYDNYSFYCERMGLKKESSISFGKRIKDVLSKTYNDDCNIRETFNGRRQRGYRGIGLIENTL